MPDFSYLPQIALSGIGVGCIYGLIGIGFCVIYNASGIVNFAQGAFVMLGGMLTYVAFQQIGLPLLAAAVLAIAIVAALGVVVDQLVVRPLWDRKATMFVMILATLAVQIVVERLTLIGAGDQPKSLPPLTDLPPLKIGGIAISFQFLWIVALSLVLIWLLDLFFKKTRTGKAMRACAINREAAALQGIPVSRMLALSFAWSVVTFFALSSLPTHDRQHVSTLFTWLHVGGFRVDMAFLADPLSVCVDDRLPAQPPYRLRAHRRATLHVPRGRA